jgi:hypothetical protein
MKDQATEQIQFIVKNLDHILINDFLFVTFFKVLFMSLIFGQTIEIVFQ